MSSFEHIEVLRKGLKTIFVIFCEFTLHSKKTMFGFLEDMKLGFTESIFWFVPFFA